MSESANTDVPPGRAASATVSVSGLATSRGFAAGPVFIYSKNSALTVPEYVLPESDVESEVGRFRSALAETRRQIEELSAKFKSDADGITADVLANHLLLLDDPMVVSAVERRIRDEHLNAEAAIRRTTDDFRAMFAKMKDLSCGIGCEKLETKDFESPDAFCDYIKEKGFATIEDVVENHPDIAAIYPFSTNCFRVITLIDAQGVPHAIYAVFKMGINGRVVDNYGLHGPIDLETGEFMFPAHSGDTTADIQYTEHPYSHTPLISMVLPYWREVLKMAEDAALVIPQMRYVGWDIAVTPSGPAIIEGNNYCAHDFWQLPGQTPGGIGIMPTIEKIIPEFKYK